MTGLDDMIPESAKVDWDKVRCPNCQTDSIRGINTGMAYCDNEGCRVFNFRPLKEDER